MNSSHRCLQIAFLAASLAACGGVTVYEPASPPSPRCMIIAPVKYSLVVPGDSPVRGMPREELRARVLESCKEEARDAGANALLVTEQAERDAPDGKGLTLKCSGMAYACP